MKILHLISGGDDGGAKTHVITLLKELSKYEDITLVCMLEENFAKEAKKSGDPRGCSKARKTIQSANC